MSPGSPDLRNPPAGEHGARVAGTAPICGPWAGVPRLWPFLQGSEEGGMALQNGTYVGWGGQVGTVLLSLGSNQSKPGSTADELWVPGCSSVSLILGFITTPAHGGDNGIYLALAVFATIP